MFVSSYIVLAGYNGENVTGRGRRSANHIAGIAREYALLIIAANHIAGIAHEYALLIIATNHITGHAHEYASLFIITN